MICFLFSSNSPCPPLPSLPLPRVPETISVIIFCVSERYLLFFFSVRCVLNGPLSISKMDQVRFGSAVDPLSVLQKTDNEHEAFHLLNRRNK